jgi:hypothetical protein
MMALLREHPLIGEVMSGQQPPPYPGPYGQQPPGEQPPQHHPQQPQNPQQPPPYPGPPTQPPPYPGQYGQPPPYGQQQQPYPGPYPQQPGQQYPGYQQYPAYPQPAAKEPIDSTARMLGWIIAGTGLLVAIAAFLTWGTIDAFGGSFDINGVTGSDVPGDDETKDGVLTLILAIPVVGFAVVRGIGHLSLTAAIIGTVAGALIVLIAIVDMADITSTGDDLPGGGAGIDASIGIGLWLTLVGGLAMALVSIVGIIKRR